jgi:hypothetical protein
LAKLLSCTLRIPVTSHAMRHWQCIYWNGPVQIKAQSLVDMVEAMVPQGAPVGCSSVSIYAIYLYDT